MKKQVDNIISIESIMSNYTYSPKKNLSISQKNINSDDFKNVEKLFEFDSNSDQTKENIKEARLLTNDIEMPRTKAQYQSGKDSQNNSKLNAKKKLLKKRKLDPSMQEYMQDANMEQFDHEDSQMINELDANNLNHQMQIQHNQAEFEYQNQQMHENNSKLYDPLLGFNKQEMMINYEFLVEELKNKAEYMDPNDIYNLNQVDTTKAKEYNPMFAGMDVEDTQKQCKLFELRQADILGLLEKSLASNSLFESVIEALIFSNKRPSYILEDIGDVLYLDFELLDECKDKFEYYSSFDCNEDSNQKSQGNQSEYSEVLKWFFERFEEINKFTELPRFIFMGSRQFDNYNKQTTNVVGIACNLNKGSDFSKYSSFYERPVVFMLDSGKVVGEDLEVFFKRVSLLVMEYFKSSGQDLEIEQPVAHQFIIPRATKLDDTNLYLLSYVLTFQEKPDRLLSASPTDLIRLDLFDQKYIETISFCIANFLVKCKEDDTALEEYSHQLWTEIKRCLNESQSTPEEFNEADFNAFYIQSGLENLNLSAEELEKIKVEFFYSN